METKSPSSPLARVGEGSGVSAFLQAMPEEADVTTGTPKELAQKEESFTRSGVSAFLQAMPEVGRLSPPANARI